MSACGGKINFVVLLQIFKKQFFLFNIHKNK